MNDTNARWVLPLESPALTLSNAGGKAANLAQLLGADVAVPAGFVLITTAYDAFVELNRLDQVVSAALQSLDPTSPAALEAASESIQSAFRQGTIPDPLISEIQSAYQSIGEPPVAVRSSATAEDLPTASFAGQQDTYLNVIGLDALLESVRLCWGSLWTARAIGYRLRQGMDSGVLALAVIVQEMVDSEVSGVLFTANPLSGKRDEIVIDSTFGLGEALVSGQVEPDHYVVAAHGKILKRQLGSKGVAIHGQQGGGTREQTADRAQDETLTDGQVREIARIGREIAEHFGKPQDIEWAWAESKLYILQSRPITTLYPLPTALTSDPLHALFSFGAIQGMLDPMTPLGRDMIMDAFAGAAELFGHKQSLGQQRLLNEAGERLWADMTPMIHNKIGRRITLKALASVEPSVRAILVDLLKDGEFRKSGLPRLGTVLSVIRFGLRILPGVVLTARNPEWGMQRFTTAVQSWLDEIASEVDKIDDLASWLEVESDYARRMFVVLLPAFLPAMAVGMASYNILIHLERTLPEGDREIEIRTILRGLPRNVTTDMDMNLWRTAEAIRGDDHARGRFMESDPKQLAADYKEGKLPPKAQTAVDDFMRSYGMRGLGEIDIGRRRWQEAPQPLFEALSSYLRIDNPEQAPVAVYERGRQEAKDAVDELIARLRSTRGGWLKAKVANGAARRARALLGARETPKFTIIQMYWKLRCALLEQAEAYVARGELAESGDVFFLHLEELEAVGRQEDLDAMAVVRERRQDYRREENRRLVPRVLLSDGRAFYRGLADKPGGQAGGLTGDPVSPGVTEGRVRVVFDPGDANLQPGEILVCPGTDPSWTPLFLAAAGLVMEVGGMMTHGAVVAREYGIPAVVGVHDATQRLQTGQLIRVDGSSGSVTMLTKTEREPVDPADGA